VPNDWKWVFMGGRDKKADPQVPLDAAAPDGEYVLRLFDIEDSKKNSATSGGARVQNLNALDVDPFSASRTILADALYCLTVASRRNATDASLISQIQLLASPVEAPADDTDYVVAATQPFQSTAFQDVTVQLDTSVLPQYVGHYLKVALRVRKDPPGSKEVRFDNVRLSVDHFAPEPGSAAILVLGGLILARRRSRPAVSDRRF
jgi:hypothetical protein